MSTFVLVHGGWHGGWCWTKVKYFLQMEGHIVFAPDLPGHGKDKTPIYEITLKTYTDRIIEVIESQDEKVILVGHSMGGIIISQVAEIIPAKIEKLIFLSAFLIHNNETLLDYSLNDKDSLLASNLLFNEDKSCVMIKKESIEKIFYSDCLLEDIENAKQNLVDKIATAPLSTPIRITQKNFGQIPIYYIELLNDQAMSPKSQAMQYSKFNCRKILSMKSNHSPFFSDPLLLSDHLKSL
jgi:esterase/lipase